MSRATSVLKPPFPMGFTTSDTVLIDAEGRLKRRQKLVTEKGAKLDIDLPAGEALREGDALKLDSGALVLVKAAPEKLFQIHPADIYALARICWHLGNSHTPVEVAQDALYILPDDAMAEMIDGLGGHVHLVDRPFDPEGGPYGSPQRTHGHAHGHHHHHGHDHD